MQNFVLDASTVLSLFLPGESDKANSIIYDHLFSGAIAHVPYIWHLELSNVLAWKEMQGKIPPGTTATVFDTLDTCSILSDSLSTHREIFSQVKNIIFEHRLTSYDATYVELALRLNIPLATLDQDMIQVAKNLGITVLN